MRLSLHHFSQFSNIQKYEMTELWRLIYKEANLSIYNSYA